MINIYFFQTQIGTIGIAEEDNRITNVFFETDYNKEAVFNGDKFLQQSGFYLNETALLREAGNQLDEYLKGKRIAFDLPLAPKGTDFMKTVWNCLNTIPYGDTKSYKQIAEAAGNPKACRAVGMANNKNPIPIFIPCHRVVGANGSLTGYRGGLEIKQKLLEIEKRKI
ncbi:methylated-DNA--[protein]-cysteine S-methyltransferase [Ruminiclostridium papyrosolvens]|uniref:Methylated-DNA--protein-cysteine methyltransferase n=1 Tax=Ruminiclostridium papyrosolvens C7 TaxID=1330534 RepID=U4R242_9FIRM|nr:methylated-DNA--[protein]-cysteine S-methyltransferase [Ruminiclostridium papyrosolvens]EPR12147.1 methylated-DNA--protein-cysteine methyltransferase [Ruminiclostridium papyrosolvens C7]